MTFNDFYEIEVLVNKDILSIEPSGYSFQIEDSIHKTYPTTKFWLNDITGIMQEYLMTVEGLKYQISYGTTDTNKIVKASYVVTKDSLMETLTEGMLNGTVKIELLHEYYDQQEILSKAYTDRISLVVRELSNKYNFSSRAISGTGNQDTWYQMLCTDEEFMRHVLLPNAFANDSFSTPFFLFIGVDNSFHWVHYKEMIDQSPVAELVYVPRSEAASISKNTIRSIQRVHVPTKLKRRGVFQVDYTDGSLIEDEDNVRNYPSNTGMLPIIENEELQKGYLYQGYTEREQGRSESDKGYQFHTMRDSLFVDRFVVALPLNVEIRAGKVVTLDIRSYETDDGEQSSLLNRGKFLVESAKHSWDGTNQTGYTTALISRKQINVPNSYIIRNQLMGA